MTLSDDQAAEKAWNQRNSDGINTFEGERTQSPPSFDLTDYDLPMTDAQRIAEQTDENGNPLTDRGAAIRHIHVFDPTLVDPDS